MTKELLTAMDLARRLQVKPETVRAWARKGIIPSLHPTQKTLRFEMEDVLRALGQKNNTGQQSIKQSQRLMILRGNNANR